MRGRRRGLLRRALLHARGGPLKAGEEIKRAIAIAAQAAAFATPAAAQTSAEERVDLGARAHGGFGTFIAVGIRIGQDAMRQLDAQPRELDVTYYDGVATPCPCIADGVMIATYASPGQGTLRVASEKAPADLMGVVVIRSRKTGRAIRYTIPDALRPKLAERNEANEPLGRYRVVMVEPEAGVVKRETLAPTFVPR